MDASISRDGDAEPPMLLSYTRKITADSLELLVPSLPFLYRYLLTEKFTLRFALNLPSGPVIIEGVPTSDRPLDADDTDIGYIVTGDEVMIEAIPSQYIRHDRDDKEMERIINVRIKQMGAHDRARYDEYLTSLTTEYPLITGPIVILPDEDRRAAPAETNYAPAHRSGITRASSAPKGKLYAA